MAKKLKSNVEGRYFFLPDIHVPEEDKLTMRAVERYMADVQVDGLIYAGDFMDMNCISAHNKFNLRAVEGQSLEKDYEAGNKMLDRHQNFLGGIPTYFLEGNHEYRVERYIDAKPELAGSIEVPLKLKLQERGILWVPSWSKGHVLTIGKANFSHGFYDCANHAKKTLDSFADNLFYGHTHDVECYSKLFYGQNFMRVAQSFGCLRTLDPDYMRGRPDNWQQAFGEFIFRPDGYFNYYVIMVFDHAFTAPNGKFYDGKVK